MNTEVELKCPKCQCDTMYKMSGIGYVCTRCGYCPDKSTYLKASYDSTENREQDYSSTYMDQDVHVD